MGLNIGNLGRFQIGHCQCLVHNLLLRMAVGNCETTTRTILIDRRTGNHSQNTISVSLGVAQTFQHQKTTSLASTNSVGSCIKGLTATIRRQHFCLGCGNHAVGRQNQVYTARQSHVALFAPQALTSLMNSYQRRRTGCIDGHGRPRKTKNIRKTSSRCIGRRACNPVGFEINIGRLLLSIRVNLSGLSPFANHTILVQGNANEDSC